MLGLTSFLFAKSDTYNEFTVEVLTPLGRLVWILFTILAVIFFTVGCIMLQRLRHYFKDFYRQFGCSLWVANVVLTIPLTFRAIFDALSMDDSWYNYWIGEGNYYRLAGYNMLLFTFGTYIPMLTQISTLIFGFVRQKQVKLFRSYHHSEQDRRPGQADTKG